MSEEKKVYIFTDGFLYYLLIYCNFCSKKRNCVKNSIFSF